MAIKSINRRRFIRDLSGTALATLSMPYVIPSSALGKNGRVSPGNRITMGFIGVGGMGTGNLRGFLQLSDAHVVAVCDVDTNHRNLARDLVNKKYDNTDCATYNDFRELLARKDIDAVCISVPDHWHALAAVTAVRAGKDIYAEKPLAFSIAEGRAIVDAVAKHGTVWQTGSQQRSDRDFRFAAELVRNGRIGQVNNVHVALPYGNSIREDDTRSAPVPEGFDYDRWLGPAPWAPYSPARCHWNFRWISDYSQGQITDWAGHHCDIAQWAMDTEMTAPMEVEGERDFPKAEDGFFDTPNSYRFECKYKEGFTLLVTDHRQHPRNTNGVLFYGSEGWIWINRSLIDAHPQSLLRSKIGSNDVHLYKSDHHRQNFLDCVKTRTEPVAPARVAHRSIMIAHLGVIAMKLGRKLYWNPQNEKFVNDSDADKMLFRPMRGPWHL